MTGILLCDGSSLGECSQVNVQTQLGSDVMMRIMHAIRGKEKELQQMVVQQIESMAENILRKAGRKNEQNIIFTVVGNTTMSHLFLGRDVKGLAGAPFVGELCGKLSMQGQRGRNETFFECLDSCFIQYPGTCWRGCTGSDRSAGFGKRKKEKAVSNRSWNQCRDYFE